MAEVLSIATRRMRYFDYFIIITTLAILFLLSQCCMFTVARFYCYHLPLAHHVQCPTPGGKLTCIDATTSSTQLLLLLKLNIHHRQTTIDRHRTSMAAQTNSPPIESSSSLDNIHILMRYIGQQ